MASSNRIDITFLVIVQGNELAVCSVGLRGINSQGRSGEMAYWHLFLPRMPTPRFRASDMKVGVAGFEPATKRLIGLFVYY